MPVRSWACLDALIIVVRNADEDPDVRALFEIEHQIPASSIASHAVSSSSRCCGSMYGASRGEIPKNCGSNWSIPSRNPPRLAIDFPGDARLRIVEALHVPAVRRHFAHCVPAFDQKFPKGFRIIDAAGKAAADPIMAIPSLGMQTLEINR